MDDGEAELFFEGVEVAITVKQRVLFADAETRNQAVNRLPHRVSAAAQRPIVSRGIPSHLDAARVEYLQRQQLSLDVLRDPLVAHTLQDLAQDEISEGETLPLERCVKPVGLRIRYAAEIIDPDGGVDDDHRSSPRDATLT